MENANKIAKRQEELGQQLKTNLTNFKKDSASRKTRDNILQRLEKSNDIWTEIQSNHQQFVNLKISHNYLDIDYFNQLKTLYEDQVKIFNAALTDISTKDVTLNSNPTIQMEQKKRLKKEEVRMTELLEIITHINSINVVISQHKYNILLQEIEKKWDSVFAIHEEIVANEDEYNADYFITNKFESIKKSYKECKQNLENKFEECFASKIILPEIKIPIFNGGYESWANFQEIFKKVIHNNSNLSCTEKMNYLKSHVRGEAGYLIKHLHIQGENYQPAWQLLESRYKNTRRTVSSYIGKILDIPNTAGNNSSSIKKLHDQISECLGALKNYGIDTVSWDPIIAEIIFRKMDPETKNVYEQSIQNTQELQNLSDILKFLNKRFQTLELVETANIKKVSSPTDGHKIKICSYCKKDHNIFSCQLFKAQSSYERLKIIRNNNLCPKCILHKTTDKCYSKNKCYICNKDHHTMLHVERNNYNSRQNGNNSRSNNMQNKEEKSRTANHYGESNNSALLATAMVEITSYMGANCTLRVLIDQGSQSSFISEEAADILAYPRQQIKVEVTGVGNREPIISKSKIEVEIRPRYKSNYYLSATLLVLPKLTKTIPHQELKNSVRDNFSNKLLADPMFDTPSQVDIILGAEEYSKIILSGIFKTEEGVLGQNTKLGWILSGIIKSNTPNNLHLNVAVSDNQVDEQLKKFWEIEEVSSEKEFIDEEIQCEEYYNKTTMRNADGSYTVSIPFKYPKPDLGESKSRAMCRLFQLEKRFFKDDNLRTKYIQFMDEYKNLGHMSIVPKQEEYNTKYYIPHQAVLKETQTDVKIRVVFDASCKSSKFISLNDVMCTGPRLQQDLFDIVLRWRKYPVVISADIEKMYRQIKISAEDKLYHRILWRNHNKEQIREYELNTVTYGTTSAPYLAIRTLNQLATDVAHKYPNISNKILTDFYVDDFLSGANCIIEAQDLVKSISHVLSLGGFNITKWSSNYDQVLEVVPSDKTERTNFHICENEMKKSLGILWSPTEDNFQLKINFCKTKRLTKRYMLSEISKIFDPLGWVSPVTIKAKLYMQELWIEKLKWDEKVPEKLSCKWDMLKKQLEEIETIKVSRWFHFQLDLELHGFSDASERAYGAVVYAKTIHNNETKIHLLCSKSKVAPIKSKLTIPKLELCAALLLAKLMKRVETALNVQVNIKKFAWTDSMVVIGWIKGDSSRWKSFISNRIKEIKSLFPESKWYHVKSEDNPADAVSRGVDTQKLKQMMLWWHGPDFLQQKEYLNDCDELRVEVEHVKACHQIFINHNEEDITLRFSRLFTMLRVLSYCFRFINIIRKENENTGTSINRDEIKQALQKIIKYVQSIYYAKEMAKLQKKEEISNKSNILTLNPFIDKNGIIRVGGRLENAILSYEEKHPMIIPYEHHITKLIVRDAHERVMHGGLSSTLAYIRRVYWIPNVKKAIKAEINKCVTCIRYKTNAMKQQMGNLPTVRVVPSPPFSHTGIDYAGPIQIRMSKGRGCKSHKGYIAIFICMCTKAVHFEVVSDLTTDAFIAAFKRFVSRRGNCSDIFSDNGSTFVGANRLLNIQLSKIFKESAVQDKLTNIGIKWHFIPPSSPHMGGLWEANIKSMKYHFKRIIGNATLTFEEITTLLNQIEACMNSRPLGPVSNDVTDCSALTPGHFLIGRPIISTPSVTNSDCSISSLSQRWKLIEKIRRDFWKIWSSDYLNNLQQRYKWKNATINIDIGELVIIKDENINPSKWPLGRIIETHTGKDGLTRVVTLKKGDGTILKRSIHKLIHLPCVEHELPHSQKREKEKCCYMSSYGTTTKFPSSAVTEGHKKNIRSPNKSRCNNDNIKQKKICPQKFCRLLIWLLFFGFLIKQTAANYTIQYLKPGLYIEHLGKSQIERGHFRIEVKITTDRLNNDIKEANRIIQDMHSLCYKSQDLSAEVSCDHLTQHMREEEHAMMWLKDSLNTMMSNRKRRGILGKVLTAVFGVNDEVYEDIQSLSKNQQNLIRAANHQTKFMLNSLSSFNDTENRIYKHMESFRLKLNEGLKTIDEMQHWYVTTDENQLKIQVLTSYQLGLNYLHEIKKRYEKIINMFLNRGSIYDFLTPAHVENIIKESNKNLPSNVQIIAKPIIKNTIEYSGMEIKVYGYFFLGEINDFDLIKVHPIPLKVELLNYWIIDVPDEVVAINYNSQLYFLLNTEEFNSCTFIKSDTALCSPASVVTIDHKGNCLIDEIYNRAENNTCALKKIQLNSPTWKQLYKQNTWLFFSINVTRVAIICNGQRSDERIQGMGVIHIGQDCSIITEHNILTAKKLQDWSTVMTYHKPASIKINTTWVQYRNKAIAAEPILRKNDELQNLVKDEKNIQEELQEDVWIRLKWHSAISGITSILITIIIVFGIIILYKWRSSRTKPGTSNSNATASDSAEILELQPLYADVLQRNTIQEETC